MPPTASDNLRSVLDPLPFNNAVKAQVWNSFYQSKDVQSFQQTLDQTSLPREVKAQLWNMKQQMLASTVDLHARPLVDENKQKAAEVSADLSRDRDVRNLDTLTTVAPFVAGAAGGGIAARAGLPLLRSAALSGLAGAGGEGAAILGESAAGSPNAPQTSGEAAERMLFSGGLQMALEGMGGVFGKVLSRLVKGSPAMADQTVREVADLNSRGGLRLTAPEITGSKAGAVAQRVGSTGLLGQVPAAKAQAEGLDKATQLTMQLLDTIAPQSSNQAAGQVAKTALKTGSDVFHRAGGQEIADILKRAEQAGIEVDMTPLQQEVTNEVRAALKRSIPSNPATLMPPDQAKVLKSILKTGGTKIPFGKAKGIQEGIGDMLKQPDLMAGKSQGSAKHYYGRMLDVLDDSLKADPQLQSRFRAWRQFYAEGGDLFGESTVADIAKVARKEPEKLIAQIKGGDISKAQQLRKALLGYNQFATPAEQAANTKAWEQLQRQYAEKLLVGKEGTDLYGLKDRMKEAGDDVLQEMFHGNPQALHNLRNIAEAMSRVQQTGGTNTLERTAVVKALAPAILGTSFGHPTMGGVATAGYVGVPYALSRVIYSPRATELFVRGLSGLALNSRVAAVRGLGRGMNAAAPYYGTAIADLQRAIAIAASAPESNQSPTEE